MKLGVKNPPANAGNISDMGLTHWSGDPLEEGIATHSSTLAWRIPWTEAGYSLWGHKELVTTEQLTPSVSVHRMDLVLRPISFCFCHRFLSYFTLLLPVS